MTVLISGANIYRNKHFEKADLLVVDGKIADISPNISRNSGITVYNFNECYIFPGFVDVHVHLREPGFVYKEDIYTGTLAATHGGFTHVCCMPNLNPVPDSRQNILPLLDAIRNKAVIDVRPYGALTVGEKGEKLSDIQELCDSVIAFSDDGRGVQSDETMKSAMQLVKKCGKILAAHCEVNELIRGGYIHDGEYARMHNHKGICSECEWRQIERDIKLAKQTKVKYHVCHISAKESVSLIREAKHDGVDITCETAPHYLIFNDCDIQEDARFKMNPPIRSESDRLALIDGIKDGTVDMIATDHAPHSAQEKSAGLEKSHMGVVGLETSFAAMYTHLVKPGIITLERLMELLHDNPKERFDVGNDIEIGNPADFCVFSLKDSFKVNPDDFLSKGRATPFDSMTLYGKNMLTMLNDKIVYSSLGDE